MNTETPEIYKLPQIAVAELVGKSPVWIRDHVSARLEDGAYDARSVVRRVIEKTIDSGTLEEGKLRARNKLLEERIRKLARHDDRDAMPICELRDVLLHQVSQLRALASELGQVEVLTGQDAQKQLNQRIRDIHKAIEEGGR